MLISEYMRVIYQIRNNELLDNLSHFKHDMICQKLYSILKELASEDTYQKLQQLSNEYEFFNNLHIQSKYDDIISLIKCSERLGINIESNINIKEPNYSEIWIEIINKIDNNNTMIDIVNEIFNAYLIQYDYFINDTHNSNKTLLKVQCLEKHLNEDYQFIDISNLLEELYFKDYVNFIHGYDESSEINSPRDNISKSYYTKWYVYDNDSSYNNKNRPSIGLGALFG